MRLLCSSERCDEELRLYAEVRVVPLCGFAALFAMLGGLYLCVRELLKFLLSGMLQR